MPVGLFTSNPENMSSNEVESRVVSSLGASEEPKVILRGGLEAN